MSFGCTKHNPGPDEIKLFFRRERPQGSHGGDFDFTQRQCKVRAGEGIPIPDACPWRMEEYREKYQEPQVRRKNSPHAPKRLPITSSCAAPVFQTEKYPRNQVSAQGKEEIDSHPQQWDMQSMGGEHHENRDCPKTVDLRMCPHASWLAVCDGVTRT